MKREYDYEIIVAWRSLAIVYLIKPLKLGPPRLTPVHTGWQLVYGVAPTTTRSGKPRSNGFRDDGSVPFPYQGDEHCRLFGACTCARY